ncbi:MAG: pyridoxal phosphate-dependent aminotransferase [Myxococcota bacterium]
MDAETSVFRPVPRTGVIYVMTRAQKRGFHYGHPEWSNLGQGAPEAGEIPGCAPRIGSVSFDHRVDEYAPVHGIPELREAVANLYNERFRKGMPSQYTAENVAVSPGGRAGLTRIAASLGSVNLGHFLPDYTAYEELLDIFKAFVPLPVVTEREHGFALTADQLRREIVNRGLGALLLSNPCNPTGQVVRGGALRAWVDTCRKYGVALILDEFYSHFLYGDAVRADGPALSAARYVEDVNVDPVVLIDGLTKNWRYPGWRLSWTVGPRWLTDRLASAGSFLDGGPAHPLQKAAVPLLAPEVADREARAIQAAFGIKRDLVVDRLRAMGIRVDVVPSGAFYVFAGLDDLPESLRDGMAFFERALERQVIVVPGQFFDVNPGKRRSHIPSRLKNHVRISFGPSIDSVRLGLDRLDAMIREA